MTESRMMVMVSSLERHLENERKIVFEAVYGQNAFPIGLAYPPIPANYIHKLNLTTLSDADYVLLLIGSEYGALTDKGVGYIHATFAAAQAARKPVISMVYSGPVKVKTDPFDQKRLEGFLPQLKTSQTYYWKDAESLRDQTEMALEKVFEQYPSVGWQKADLEPMFTDSNKADQLTIAKLKQQVASLQQQVKSKSRQSSGAIELPDFSKDSRPWRLGYQCNAFREGRLKQSDGKMSYGLSGIFDWLGPTLLAPVTESRVRAVLASRIHPDVLKEAQRQWPGCHAVSDIKIDPYSLDELKVRFRALGLVAFDDHGRWHLTEGGEKLALNKETTS